MGDIAFCYEIKSQRLLELLEARTSPEKRSFIFGRQRIVDPKNFGLDKRDFCGSGLYYADTGFPGIRLETTESAINAGRIQNPFTPTFAQRLSHITNAKMLLAQPEVEWSSTPKPSKSRELIKRVIGNVITDLTFDTPEADLSLHGYYLATGHNYTLAKDLPPEFLAS